MPYVLYEVKGHNAYTPPTRPERMDPLRPRPTPRLRDSYATAATDPRRDIDGEE